MSVETKRLLKCDLLYALKDILVFVLIMAGLQVWYYFMYKVVANPFLIAAFVVGMPIVIWGIKDWQIQIRMYVSMGMTRKRIFRVLIIRNALVILAALMVEAVMAFREYPGFGIKFLSLLVFFLLFIWGFGQIAGVLAYQGKMLGKILMLIGYMMVGMLSAGCVMTENQMDFWNVLLSVITPVGILIIGIVAVTVLAGGICFAKKQISNYMVY